MTTARKTTQPSYDPQWQTTYQDMIATPGQAVAKIEPGRRIFIGTGCAQPLELVNALVARSRDLPDTEIVHLLTVGHAPYAVRELSESFHVNSFFIAENVRELIQEGLGDYTPVFLSEIPRLFSSGQMPLDVALIQVSPPDTKGFCSLGISVDIVKSAAENASLVIAQVNPNMPRTMGNSLIHVQDMDVLVPVDTPLIEFTPKAPDEVTRNIGQYVASLVDDHSTVEVGIGSIPQAVLEYLTDKKDLGIHTEMFTDSIIPLLQSGAVTGARKSRDRGKIVASFCMGTRKLYDFIDGNPLFSFHPTEYVNDPFVISQQHLQVAINVALEVDLSGQICSDSVGTRFYSGIGGQVDFNRGAARSEGGKAIIALPSTAKNGTVSRIVTRLSPGAGVSISRADVHYVVTEYGVAYLHGKSVQERTMALITIAHPDFRPQLLRDAIEAKYLRADMAGVEGKLVVSPPDFKTTFVLGNGTPINFRSIRPTDEPRMRDLFYALSEETIYYRFMSRLKHVQRKQIQDFVFIDHRTDAAIVGTIPEAYGDEIVCIGRYYVDPKTHMAEVAFVVNDKWQSRGIGTFLLNHMITIAKRNGISGFTAEVLKENRAMQRVFEKCRYKVTCTPHEDVFSYRVQFG